MVGAGELGKSRRDQTALQCTQGSQLLTNGLQGEPWGVQARAGSRGLPVCQTWWHPAHTAPALPASAHSEHTRWCRNSTQEGDSHRHTADSCQASVLLTGEAPDAALATPRSWWSGLFLRKGSPGRSARSGEACNEVKRRRSGGLTSTYRSGKIPILSPSIPSAQLSSTLLITVRTSSWGCPARRRHTHVDTQKNKRPVSAAEAT